MYNLYSAMAVQPCTCQRHIHYEEVEKGATDDSRFYLFEANEYMLYKIVSTGRKTVSASRILTQPWEPLLRVPDFGNVGIFQTVGISEEVVRFPKAQIKGKVIMVGTLAVTIPLLILQEAC